MSPNVVAERRAVYFQNPSPFYSLNLTELHLEPKFTLFNWFYLYLYRINIKSNNFVVVQQDWFRRELKRRFGNLNVVVAHPALTHSQKRCSGRSTPSPRARAFFFPSYPRIHKNAEVIGRAVEALDASDLRSGRMLDPRFKAVLCNESEKMIALRPSERNFV
jgi:hypothetical protein